MSKVISAFRGSLDLYYQIEDSSGNFGEVVPAGNVTNFEIAPDSDELEVLSTGNADYGQAADSMVDAKPTKATWGVDRFNIDNWELAFAGEKSVRNASAGSVTDEVITATLGGIFKVDGMDISSVVIQDNTDTTTYVDGTDWEIVDAKLGLIKVLSTGSITDAQELHVDYDTAAESGWLLKGGTKSSKFLKVFGRGINRFNNKETIVKIARGSVRSTGGFSFVGTGAANMGFEMTITAPADGSPPFELITEA